MLDASGFHQEFQRRMMRWFICKRIYEFKKQFHHVKNQSGNDSRLHRDILICVFKVERLLDSNIVDMKKGPEDATPISLRQLESILRAGLIGLAVGAVAFMVELIRKDLKIVKHNLRECKISRSLHKVYHKLIK